MLFQRSNCCLLVFVIIASAFGQDKLTPRQRSRITDAYKKAKGKETSIFDIRSRHLFEIINSRPENKDIEFESCKVKPLKIPDLRADGLRISDVKCLEYMWKMRYYDEVLIALSPCGEYYESDLIKLHYGGVQGVPGAYPHMGAIGWETLNNTWLFICEGALISEKFVLTTISCIKSQKGNSLLSDSLPKVMRFGVVDISDKEEAGKSPSDVFIRKVFINPYFRYKMNYYDIALIELDREIVFSTQVHPACIWTDLNIAKGKGVLTGWTVVESNKTVKVQEYVINSFDVFGWISHVEKSAAQEIGKSQSDMKSVLQFSKVRLMDPLTCEGLTKSKRNNQWRGLLNHQLCARKYQRNDHGTCQMQHFGTVLQAPIKYPEVSDWKMHFVIGVRSFDFDCSLSHPISVYTRACTFLDWIEDIVWGKNNNLSNNSSLTP